MSNAATGVVKELRKVARKGRKGHLYRSEPPPRLPIAEEQVRILKRRVQKAERDERMDITMAITPPKTWMGGFTRPRDIRASNWFPGGPYVLKGKVYESPHEFAYEPHTVFLLESRHRVRHGVGRVDSKDHVVGVCRAADWVKIVAKYNSKRCPGEAKESMDNACWPWLAKSGKVLKPTRWWGPDENLEDIMKEIYEDKNYSSHDVSMVNQQAEEEVEEDLELGNQKKLPKIIPPDPTAVTEQKPAGDAPASGSRPNKTEFDIDHIRNTYQPLLATEPFWLPLLAITYSTRPLALTLARLSKGRERGLPFYASMSNDDRKSLFSYSNRMTSMRLDRMRQLTIDTISRLAGHKGGFIGIRFNTHEKGRGIAGESLADPIPRDKRIVKVYIGNWFYRSQAEAELYLQEAEEWGSNDAIDVAMMNEWGRRLDADGNEVPLTEAEMSTDEIQDMEDNEAEDAEDAEDEEESDEMEDTGEEEALLRNPISGPGNKWKFKPALLGTDEVATELRRKLAYRLVGGHRSVIKV